MIVTVKDEQDSWIVECAAEASRDEVRTAVTASVRGIDYARTRTCWWHGTFSYRSREEVKESLIVQIDPAEPRCKGGGEHDWQRPIRIVGGIESSPGVEASGGGVLIKSACMLCGCGRTVDTWAHDAGRDGLTSVEYEPGRYLPDLLEEDP